MYQDDDKQLQDPTDQAVPHDLSNHDERDEELATDLAWDDRKDAMTEAAKHLDEFEEEDVALSDEDWDREEKQDDEIVDHLSAAVDAAESGMHMSDFDGLEENELTENPSE